jgi:glucan endo-1,3-alpha-glucosidase
MAWMDGEFNWNSGWPMGSTDLDTSSDVTYQNALAGKTYMPAISPAFFTYYGPNSWNKDWIYRSDDWLLATRLEQIVQMRSQVDFAEIISWNGMMILVS